MWWSSGRVPQLPIGSRACGWFLWLANPSAVMVLLLPFHFGAPHRLALVALRAFTCRCVRAWLMCLCLCGLCVLMESAALGDTDCLLLSLIAIATAADFAAPWFL